MFTPFTQRFLVGLFWGTSFCQLPAQTPDLYDINTLRTVEITFADPNWRTTLEKNWPGSIYVKATVKVENQIFQNVGVRYRGFSTYLKLPATKTDKRPFKISADAFVPGQKILGYRTLNLNNNLFDPTLTREILGYEFLRKFVPAPRSNYIKVQVNNQDFGVFINTQQVNKDLLASWFRDNGGNRYKGERALVATPPVNDTALTWLGWSIPPYEKAYQLKTTPGPTSWTDLINLCDAINNTSPANIRNDLPKVLDVDNALRFLAAGNIILWLDSYLGQFCHNFFLYHDRVHDRFSLLPWDMNNCLGGFLDLLSIGGIKKLDPFWRKDDTARPRPLFAKIVANPRWRARYLAHYREMLAEFDWAKLGVRVGQLQAFIKPHVQADPLRIYSLDQFSKAVIQDTKVTLYSYLVGLKPLIEERRTFLLQHGELKKVAPAITGLTRHPPAPDALDRVWVTARLGGATVTRATLYHRWRGPFVEAAMYDDGNHHDGAANDGVYGASIPPGKALQMVEYYVSAAGNLSAGGAVSFLPTKATMAPCSYRVGVAPGQSAIVINEFMAKNKTGIRDEKGECEDWLELFNRSANTVDLSGMFLSDRFTGSAQWQIPPGYKLPPGQVLIIWADEDVNDGPLHATFKLDGAGEQIALFAKDGLTGLDAISFGPQTADVSTGRLANFPEALVTFSVPTPNRPNLPASPGNLPYGPLDSTASKTVLTGLGLPQIGGQVSYQLSGGPSQAPALFLLAIGPAQFDFTHLQLGYLLVDPFNMLVFPGGTDLFGQASFPLSIPNYPILLGGLILAQGLAFNLTGGFSNGVLMRL